MIPVRTKIINFLRPNAQVCWSQEGEDLILDKLFNHCPHGFYVDVGAYHPRRFSNTYLFYRKGWRGINIDATPNSMEIFNRIRPEDTNIETGIGTQEGSLRFFMFSEPGLNTFSRERVQVLETRHIHPTHTIDVPVMTLGKVLHQHIPAHQEIDFLTIDVETRDEDVLRSNDWTRFKPKCVLFECLENSITQVIQSPIVQFMEQQGYTLWAKTYNTVFMVQPELYS